MDGAPGKQREEGAGAGSHNMPGILPRPESTPTASIGTKMTTDSQNGAWLGGGMQELMGEDHRNGDALTNGDHEYVNGLHLNGVRTPTAIDSLVHQLPPEIQHITFGYVPFHTLISRLVQETFLGLTDAINEMSEIPIHQSSHEPMNHVNSLTNRETGSGNVQKKLRMLNFTSDRRAQFIKILILLRWAQRAEAVGKVIDLNVWLNTRLQEYRDCISWIGELKRMLVPLRDPNPDIRTALQVLSLGKAPWLSDLGYLPPELHSPQQILDTLRKIDTLISIRLNLHTNIPPAFRDFSIASGRVTFHVPEGFEVDLSIADEDPSSQFFFIDFRFAFSPTPSEFPSGRLRDEIENKANDTLKREGLGGLFDFLHSLTLTHKLTVLRNQAYEMARGYWSEQLKVETVHRSLVVQYWLGRSDGKNWVEIGLKQGREPESSYTLIHQKMPYIDLRWFRAGKEVTGSQVSLGLGDLSLTKILNQVIALHTSFNFERMATRLQESSIYSLGSLRLKNICSAVEPTDASLYVQLTTSKAIKVVQEPRSGRFSILPASQLNSRAEHELNRVASPAIEGAAQLIHLRSLVSHEEVAAVARGLGMEQLRSLNPNQEAMRKLFGNGIQHKRFFKRSSWKPSWILAFTTGSEGDQWWIVELATTETLFMSASRNTNVVPPTIHSAWKVLLLGKKSHLVEPSFETIANVEETAAGMICQLVDSRALRLHDFQHQFQKAKLRGTKTQPGGLVIQALDKTSPRNVRSSPNVDLHWLEDVVRLEFCGLNSTKRSAAQVARVHIREPLDGLQDLLARIPSVIYEPTSASSRDTIRFQFLTRVGDSVVDRLRSRLRSIGILLNFVSILRSHGLPCSTASLTRLIFAYSSSQDFLKATIHFPKSASWHITLSKQNPQLRIVDYLSQRIRSQGLFSVLAILQMTLALLQTFSLIEAGPDRAGVNILTRSDEWYQVRYSEPVLKSGYDVRLRVRRDDVMWFVSEASIKKPYGVDETFEQSLRAVTRGRGEGWWGIKGGMIASIKGIENLIITLDGVFRSAKPSATESNPRKRKAEDKVVEID